MTKYRPIKLLLILIILITIGAVLGIFLLGGWKKIVMLVCTVIMLFAFALCATYYIQFQNPLNHLIMLLSFYH